VLGSAALHVALKRYNNACWYVHEVVTLAGRYTSSARLRPRPRTRSCGPWCATNGSRPPPATAASQADLASGRSTCGSSRCWR
jgi:hypothetical protein